jgi:hypothetical protein
MDVDTYDADLNAQGEEEDPEESTGKVQLARRAAATPQGHWMLGSPPKRTTTKHVAADHANHLAFQGFQKNLFAFLQNTFPEECIDGTALKVCKQLIILSYM